MDLPAPIHEQLCQIGGIDGLKVMIPPDEELDRRGRIFNAMSEPIRLKILYLVNIQPLCVCVIKEVIDIADSKLSYHLKTLSNAGLITGEQQSNWIIYSITDAGRRCLMVWI